MTRHGLWVGTNIADRYCITGEIGGGGMGRVYRAIPFDDPAQTFAIKVIERDQLDYEDVLRFQREAALMARLRHPNIITFLELGLYQPQRSDGAAVISGYYIVMEVANGHDLKESLVRGGRKNLDFFFDLGLQVSSALEYTHAKNIIHRDIKPQNIIIERGSEGGGHLVKVLDFGIARLTELDLYTDSESNQDIAGTPLYMAPETSQYLDAPVDHRVDLYSLGCVLYEVLAGRPPFVGSTREKLARDHAYAPPEPLTAIRPDVPGLVNDVVMKLMAKHPNDRYQTAFGLHVDLQRIRRILRSQKPRGQRFVLGRYDRLNILPAKIPLVGRETEFEALVSNYNAIAKEKSRSRLAVIKGEAGIGKTRLLKEFRAYLARHKIRYISTSFSRHENNLPFNALANGFNEYLIHIFKSQPTEAEEIKRRVRTLLGPTAALVAEVVQGLKPYLDEHVNEDLVRSELETDKADEFGDFAKAFSDFTRCLAADGEPVAIFLDDMHWADEKSLELIDRFFSYNNSQQLFLVISHRPSESANKSSFQAFLSKFSKLKRRYQEIEVQHLGESAVGTLSESILAMDQELDPRFTDFLQRKTRGNPLYILEVHRSLVTQELISLNPDGAWVCEMEEIYSTPIHSSSIDLTLNRLAEFPEDALKVLEVAAILGTQFQIDSLLISPELSRQLVQETIKDAADSGLLLKLQYTDRDSVHYAYVFCHRSISETLRDHIVVERRRELHRLVAKQTESKEKLNQPQVIFTLAHHYYQALGTQGGQDGELVFKAVQYNMLAGAKAIEVEAMLTAQRYYENARNLLPQLTIDPKQVLQAKKQVSYALADIFYANRDFTDAARLYMELRKMQLSRVEFAYISYKLALMHMVGGYVGAAIKELVAAFEKLRFPSIKADYVSFGWAALRFAWSAVRPLPRSLPAKVLRRAEPVALKNSRQSFHPFLLYAMGQDAGLNYDKRLGLVYHMEMMKRAARYGVPEDIALRVLCDHAAILAYVGLRVRAYQLLEFIQRRAQEHGWKATSAYVNFIQVLYVDAYQGKSEDPRYQIETMKEGLQSVDFRLASMHENIYRIFCFLTQAQGKELTRLIQSLPHILTVRHWLTPRAVSMYLFWLLLTDSRDLIVSYRSFILKRAEIGSRRWDPFARITEAIVSLAAGERERSRSAYEDILKHFQDGLEEPLYLPHESDFVLLFIGVFSDVYAFEYGRELLDPQGFRAELLHVQKLTQRPQYRTRAIPILIFARLQEIFGGKRINLHYDKALRKAKMSQLPIIELFAELWFGRHLQASKALLRIDYLQKVNDRSRALQISLVYAICRKISRDQGMFLQEDMTAHRTVQHAVLREPLDHLLFEHLRLLPEFKSSLVTLEQVRAQLFPLLRERFEFAEAYLVTAQDIAESGRSLGGVESKWQQIVAYTAPYCHLRSSLTIPVGDAPWMAGETSSRTSDAYGRPAAAVQTVLAEDVGALDVTTNFAEAAGTMVFGDSQTATQTQEEKAEDIYSPVMLRQRSMNTLVPIRYQGQGIGVLLLEKNKMQDQDSTQERQLLDHLGAQIGLWLASYTPPALLDTATPPMIYASGQFHLEPCAWLHVWGEGNLKTARESLWYLGLNISDHAYLVAYCRLNGPESIRTELSSVLWHELMTLRTLMADASVEQWNADDIREAVERHFHTCPGVQNLEGIALSFSLLHRQKGEVLSGHFGPARPLVLGSEQEVTPLNRVVLSLQNGRYLRYWKVTSLSLQRNIYLLSADTNKLDTLNIQGLREAQFEAMSWEQKRWAFREFLKAQVIAGHEPPYFLAAAWNPQGATVPVLVDKAG